MAEQKTLTLPDKGTKKTEPAAEVAENEVELPDLLAEAEQPEQPEQPEPVTEEVTENEPEVDPIAEKAMKMGWRPKDQFSGDPDTWVDAAEFVRREPLFEQIRKYKKKVEDAERNVRKLAEHNSKVEKVAFERAIETLKKQKVDALESGDHRRVVEIDDEIAQRRANAMPPPNHNPFDDWLKENTWYEDNPEMADVADRAGMRYKSMHPEADANECFEYAFRAVKKQFPNEFGDAGERAAEQPQRAKPKAPAVESGRSQAVKKTYFNQLTQEEQQYVSSMLRVPGITLDKESYAKQVIDMRGR